MHKPGWYNPCVFLEISHLLTELSQGRPCWDHATGLVLVDVTVFVDKAGLKSFGVLHLKVFHLVKAGTWGAIGDIYSFL